MEKKGRKEKRTSVMGLWLLLQHRGWVTMGLSPGAPASSGATVQPGRMMSAGVLAAGRLSWTRARAETPAPGGVLTLERGSSCSGEHLGQGTVPSISLAPSLTCRQVPAALTPTYPVASSLLPSPTETPSLLSPADHRCHYLPHPNCAGHCPKLTAVG